MVAIPCAPQWQPGGGTMTALDLDALGDAGLPDYSTVAQTLVNVMQAIQNPTSPCAQNVLMAARSVAVKLPKLGHSASHAQVTCKPAPVIESILPPLDPRCAQLTHQFSIDVVIRESGGDCSVGYYSYTWGQWRNDLAEGLNVEKWWPLPADDAGIPVPGVIFLEIQAIMNMGTHHG